MVKSKKKRQPKQRKPAPEKKPLIIPDKTQDYIFILLIAILLIVLLKPLVIDGLSPQGVDVIASKGATHQTKEFEEETNEIALWNPTIFGGMPLYHRKGPVVWSVDSLLNTLGKSINFIFLYYLFAAIGTYLLLRYLKMSPLVSCIATLMFILMPHYQSLYLTGHYSKFRAVMILPWIILTFLYFLEKRHLLSIALFALAFGIQIRTQHYQIVFYTALLIFAIGIHPMLKDLFEKQTKRFLTSSTMLIVAVVLGILMAAQPLFLANEYLPYSKRGKTTIDLDAEPQQIEERKSDGVKIEYATQWSTHPSELLTWFIPRFYGGMSGEKYEGDAVPQLRNRVIPGYWGHMPFTQSYEYMGAITLLFAILGFVASRKNRLIISLAIFAVFLIFLSLGRHFESFYGLFYYYVPYFNKFRAPMMSVTITALILCIFAAYGMRYLQGLAQLKPLKEYKQLFYIIGAFLALGLLLLLFSGSFSYTKTGERYDPQIMSLLQEVRKEYLVQDVLRFLFMIIVAAISLFAYIRQKLTAQILVLILGIVVVIDLISIQSRSEKEFIDIDRLERQYFRQTSTDQYLGEDDQMFRVFPVGKLFGSNRWSYYHRSLGGYTPIKMYTIEEIVENNLYDGWEKTVPFNWNILKIMNVKYLISETKIEHQNLQLVNTDPAKEVFTYLYRDFLSHCYFVGQYRVVQDEYERLRLLNSNLFMPEKEVILEEPLSQEIAVPDSSDCDLLKFNPNTIQFDVFTDTQALFVISELYYPPGWEIYLNDQPVKKIFKTNHAIQSIVVPAGNHRIEMRFDPDSFRANIRIASVAAGILYLSLLVGGVMTFRKKRRVSGD